VLPVVSIIASFAPAHYVVVTWLSPVFHISMNTELQSRPPGLFDIAVVLVMVTFILSGYILGFVGNALILYLCFGWSGRKLKDMFLHSKIPPDWKVQ
jgi:hypothetical protein